MINQAIQLTNRLGLHARAAGKLVNITSHFQSECWISFNNRRVNAKSIMGLLTLAAPCGATLSIELSGNDEQAAYAAITELIHNRFEESE